MYTVKVPDDNLILLITVSAGMANGDERLLLWRWQNSKKYGARRRVDANTNAASDGLADLERWNYERAKR